MLCCAQWISAHVEINLAGTWRFQTDPMGFGKTPGSELYLPNWLKRFTFRAAWTKPEKVCPPPLDMSTV